MMIPTFKEMMFPILKHMSNQKINTRKDIFDFIVKHFKLNESDIAETVSSDGKTPLYQNRANWSLSYLSGNIGLLVKPRRGEYQISDLGLEISKSKEDFINLCSKTYSKKFISVFEKSNKNIQQDTLNNDTPDENLNSNLNELESAIKSELLDLILSKEPRFFENLALRLLEKIGYGVRRGELTQNGADGGIDGVVDEDALGFSKIYIQAKRFNKDAVVGRPEIQKFVGALATKPTKKGLFITTSSFSSDARAYAAGSHDYSIVLIDGERLLELMLRYKLGVQVKEIKEIFAIDSDFFDEENY